MTPKTDIAAHAEAIFKPFGINVLDTDDSQLISEVLTAVAAVFDAGACAMREAGKENWDGLARSLEFARDLNAKTPAEIFRHLERSGYEIPQWLRDESEMKALDHVPSKGTRCVLIYRAMTEDIDPVNLRDGV